MARTLLGFPIPQLQPLLPPPSKLPPSSEAGDILGCLNDGVQIPGSGRLGWRVDLLFSPALPSNGSWQAARPLLPDADHVVLHRWGLPGPIML